MSKKHRYQHRREIIAKLKAKQVAEVRREEAIKEVKQELVVVGNKVKTVSQHTVAVAIKTNHTISALLSQISRLHPLLSRSLFPVWHSIRLKVNNSPLLPSLKSGVFRVYHLLAPSLWQFRYESFIVFFGLAVGLNLWQQFSRFPNHPLKQEFQMLNNFPLLPHAPLLVTSKSFALGYNDTAFQFFQIAQTQQQAINHVGLGFLSQSYFNQVKQDLEAPKRAREEIEGLETQLKNTPFSWELLLAKAKLELELGETGHLQSTVELLSWLKPDFDLSPLTSNMTTLTEK